MYIINGGHVWLMCVGRRCADGRSLLWNRRRGRCRLFYFGGLVLADMAMATQLHSMELSSGKYDVPVIRYFQTAAFSVGFDLDAIEHERSSRQEPMNAKGYVRTSFILQQHLAKQSSVIGGNQKYCLRKFAKLEEVFKNCTIKSQDGRGLGVKRCYVKEASRPANSDVLFCIL